MEEQETIVIDVQLNEQNIRQRLGEVNTAIRSVEESNRNLKASMKENGDELGINSQLLAQNEALLKSLKAEQSALSGQVRASMQSYQKYGTSIKELTAQMNALKEEYRSLTREQREGAEGNALKQQIAELKQEIDEANHSLGDFHDNVGNYPGAVEPVTAQIKELTQALISMKVAGQENSAEYQSTLQRLGELKDAVGDAQQEIKNMASDTSNLDSVLQGAQATAGAFSAALGVMNLVGASDSKTAKELAAAQQKLQAAIAITTGIQAVQNALQKQSALMMGIQKVQALAAAKAQDMYTAAMGRATVAQRLFNFVAKQNPYVLLAMGIVSVVGAISAWIRGDKEKQKQNEYLNVQLKNQIDTIESLEEAYSTLARSELESAEDIIERAKAEGKSIEEIRAAEDELFEKKKELMIQERDRLQEDQRLYKARKESYEANIRTMMDLEAAKQNQLRQGNEEGAKFYQNEMDNLQKVMDLQKKHIDLIDDFNNRYSKLFTDRAKQEAERKKEDDAATKEANEKAKAVAEKRKEIEKQKNQTLKKLQSDFNSLVIENLKRQQEEYETEADNEIKALQHKLDTERTLTIQERADLTKQIIDLELTKNETLADLDKQTKMMQLDEQHRLELQAIEDELAELKEADALKGEKGLEIQAQYDQKKLDLEKAYEEKKNEIAREYTTRLSDAQMDAAVQTLENEEEALKESYDRREELRSIAAEKRILEAGKDEEALAQAELQNAIEEQAALLALDEETKKALGMSQEQYELLKLQSEKKIQDAEEKTIQVELKKAQVQMKAVGDIFGGMTDILDEFSENSEELAGVEKMLSLAKVAMSTGVAIAEGIAAAQAAGPYPANLAAIATTVAAIMANIATAISTINSAKFAEGGIVDGDKFFGDKIHAQLNSGEMVLNREQQSKLFRMINQPQTIGSTAELTEAFSAALSEMPNPILDYSEFTTFTNGVNERTNKTIIR